MAQPWEYRWSSAAAFALGKPEPLVDENPWYRELSPAEGRRQALWQEFVRGNDPREEEIRRGAWVIGNAAFQQQVELERGRPVRRRRGRPRKPAPNSPRISTQAQE